MTTITLDDECLTVAFPGWERWMARRSAYTVPRSAIASAEAEPGWNSQVLGFRSGLGVTGVRKLGVYRHPDGTKRLVSMSRGMSLLRVRMRSRAAGDGFDELLISTPDAAALAADLSPAQAAGR